MVIQVSIDHSLAQLNHTNGKLFAEMMKHGSMSVEIYQPVKTDPQTPHEQDELYVVIRGNREFLNDGRRNLFKPGDVLFVRAGVEHRFENFTGDFATRVIFTGQKAEKSNVRDAKYCVSHVQVM